MKNFLSLLVFALTGLLLLSSNASAQETIKMKPMEPVRTPQVAQPDQVPKLKETLLPKIEGYWRSAGRPPALIKEYGADFIIRQHTRGLFYIYQITKYVPGVSVTTRTVAKGKIVELKKLFTDWLTPGPQPQSGGKTLFQAGTITKMSSGVMAEEIVWPDGLRFVRNSRNFGGFFPVNPNNVAGPIN